MTPKELRGTPRPDLFHGAPIVPGHPGNSGGKKGRSGRKPADFKKWCATLVDDLRARKVYEERNRQGDLAVMEFAASYAHGKPGPTVTHSGEVTVHVIYDE
jgi:hypothetical protein